MEQLGLSPAQIDRVLSTRIKSALRANPYFVECKTEGCIGGKHARADAAGQPLRFLLPEPCGICRTSNVGGVGRAEDPRLVKQLLEGLKPNSIRRRDGLVRECYGCGSACEKGEACLHMTCPPAPTGCGTHWHFDFGFYGAGATSYSESADGRQLYRPKLDGVLGRLGFYDGLGIPLGATNLSPAQKAAMLTRANEWLRRLPD
jgi:hypothetical protein